MIWTNKYKWISFDTTRNKWKARASIEGFCKEKHVGYYHSEEEAKKQLDKFIKLNTKYKKNKNGN